MIQQILLSYEWKIDWFEQREYLEWLFLKVLRNISQIRIILKYGLRKNDGCHEGFVFGWSFSDRIVWNHQMFWFMKSRTLGLVKGLIEWCFCWWGKFKEIGIGLGWDWLKKALSRSRILPTTFQCPFPEFDVLISDQVFKDWKRFKTGVLKI